MLKKAIENYVEAALKLHGIPYDEDEVKNIAKGLSKLLEIIYKIQV